MKEGSYMKKQIERLNKQYGIKLNIEKERLDAFDNKSAYITKIWKNINGKIVCVTYTRIDNKEDIIKELETKIKVALGL